jgi:hypothetical protein
MIIYPNDGSKSVAAVVVSTLHIMIPIYFNFNCNVLHSCQLPGERERERECDPRLNFAVRQGTESSFKGVSTTIAT